MAQAAKVCGLDEQTEIPLSTRMVIKKADIAKRHFSNEELRSICSECLTSIDAIMILRDQSDEIVKEARSLLISKYPKLFRAGGKLYPKTRAEACWRDCQQFTRVIIYGVACNYADTFNKLGMKSLVQLYNLLEVPKEEMIFALDEIWISAKKRLQAEDCNLEINCLDKAFRNLIELLINQDQITQGHNEKIT